MYLWRVLQLIAVAQLAEALRHNTGRFGFDSRYGPLEF
jgi:hypothetical protein